MINCSPSILSDNLTNFYLKLGMKAKAIRNKIKSNTNESKIHELSKENIGLIHAKNKNEKEISVLLECLKKNNIDLPDISNMSVEERKNSVSYEKKEIRNDFNKELNNSEIDQLNNIHQENKMSEILDQVELIINIILFITLIQ